MSGRQEALAALLVRPSFPGVVQKRVFRAARPVSRVSEGETKACCTIQPGPSSVAGKIFRTGLLWPKLSKTSVEYLSDLTLAWVTDVSCISVDLSVYDSYSNSLATREEAKSSRCLQNFWLSRQVI